MKSEKLFARYLDKHPSLHKITTDPDSAVDLIVVIPAYRENELLPQTLASLCACQDPGTGVEVIVVINTSADDPESVQQEQQICENMVHDFATAHRIPPWLQVHALPAYNLRPKHFGAGLARKTGLDEAIRRFAFLSKPQGIMACLDADSPVESNYLAAIARWFANPKHQGATIHFEHPLEGEAFPAQVYEAITLYELHLRYYVQALRQTGFPYAFHTIGSTMVFRAEKYIQAGGMPKKQAGEDFYFLQKLIPLGGFGEIWNTVVKPSPRPSNRVIFGTGAAITQHINGERRQGHTYPLKAFDDLKILFDNILALWKIPAEEFEDWSYELPGPLRSFLLSTHFVNELITIQSNSATPESFTKRFFGLFNAFKVVKYLNYAQAQFYAPMNLLDASTMLLERLGEDPADIFDIKSLTNQYRLFERKQGKG